MSVLIGFLKLWKRGDSFLRSGVIVLGSWSHALCCPLDHQPVREKARPHENEPQGMCGEHKNAGPHFCLAVSHSCVFRRWIQAGQTCTLHLWIRSAPSAKPWRAGSMPTPSTWWLYTAGWEDRRKKTTFVAFSSLFPVCRMNHFLSALVFLGGQRSHRSRHFILCEFHRSISEVSSCRHSL